MRDRHSLITPMPDDPVLILASTNALQTAVESVVRTCKRTTLVLNEKELELRLEIASFTTALIEISLSSDGRSNFSGIRLAQLLRRKYDFQGALIFVGFPSLEVISADFTLLKAEVPGVTYLCAPFSASQLCGAIENTRSITAEELAHVVVAHCGIREEIRKAIHDLTHRLYLAMECDGVAGADADSLANLASEIGQLSTQLNRYFSEQISAYLAELDQYAAGLETLDKNRIERLLSLIDQIDSRLKPETSPKDQTTAWPAISPEGYETLFIADDNGFSEAGIQYLEACGYSIVVERSVEAAQATLSADPGSVFLCDQTFGDDSSAGRNLMALARREKWKLIIALSGASLDPAEVPEADAICAGPLAKLDTGARRIHQIICEWARTHP
jgi:hypothetical protein